MPITLERSPGVLSLRTRRRASIGYPPIVSRPPPAVHLQRLPRRLAACRTPDCSEHRRCTTRYGCVQSHLRIFARSMPYTLFVSLLCILPIPPPDGSYSPVAR